MFEDAIELDHFTLKILSTNEYFEKRVAIERQSEIFANSTRHRIKNLIYEEFIDLDRLTWFLPQM